MFFQKPEDVFEGNECGLLMGMAQGVDGNEDSPAEGEKSWKRKKRLNSASRLEVGNGKGKKPTSLFGKGNAGLLKWGSVGDTGNLGRTWIWRESAAEKRRENFRGAAAGRNFGGGQRCRPMNVGSMEMGKSAFPPASKACIPFACIKGKAAAIRRENNGTGTRNYRLRGAFPGAEDRR